MSKRKLLEKVGRIFLLAAVIGISLFLIQKSFDKEDCKKSHFCNKCTKYDDCKKPEKEIKKQDER